MKTNLVFISLLFISIVLWKELLISIVSILTLSKDDERNIRKIVINEFPEITKELWNDELWNPSYYVETIGSISEEEIRQYIQNQEKE